MYSKKMCRLILDFLHTVCRHEKRCDPAILDRGPIFGKMWTFLPKTTLRLDKLEICGFWREKIHKSKYLLLIWYYIYLWIWSEVSTNIYMIERNVPFFYNVISMVIIMILSTIDITVICTSCFERINTLNPCGHFASSK